MRSAALLLLAACTAEPAVDAATADLVVGNPQLIGSAPLTPVVPHLVRGASHDTQVRVASSAIALGTRVRLGMSITPGGSPGACPPALSQCIDLAEPAFQWNRAQVVLDSEGSETAVGVGVVPITAVPDQVELQAVVDSGGVFVTSTVIPRNIYDRSEVCELEIISPDGFGEYIAYTDLNVGNPYTEGLLAWAIGTSSLTVFVPSGEDLILRNYDSGDLTEVVNHDAGGATIFSGSFFETTIPVSCP